MKLSKQTLNALRNFASINANIFVPKGSKLSTIATAKNIMAEVQCEEVFPMDFGVFNLQEFLGVLGLMNNPDIEFDTKKNYMMISEGRTKIRYTFASPDILTYPMKDIKFPAPDIEFSVSGDLLSQLQKGAGAIGVQDVVFVGNGKNIVVNVVNAVDKKSVSSNEYTIDLDIPTTLTFSAFFKIENFKLIDDDYKIELSSKNISRFTGLNSKIVYYIAMEPESKF